MLNVKWWNLLAMHRHFLYTLLWSQLSRMFYTTCEIDSIVIYATKTVRSWKFKFFHGKLPLEQKNFVELLYSELRNFSIIFAQSRPLLRRLSRKPGSSHWSPLVQKINESMARYGLMSKFVWSGGHSDLSYFVCVWWVSNERWVSIYTISWNRYVLRFVWKDHT